MVEKYQENTKDLSSIPKIGGQCWHGRPLDSKGNEPFIVLVVVGLLLVGTGALGEDKGNPAETSMAEVPRALGGLRLCAATHPCPGGKGGFLFQNGTARVDGRGHYT